MTESEGLKCALCGAKLKDQDAFAKVSISAEIFEYSRGSVHATGQKCTWDGLKVCVSHLGSIAGNIEDNLAYMRRQRERDE